MQCWKIAVCQSNLFRKRCSELLQFLVCGGCKLSNTWIQFLYLSWSHRYVKISLQQNAKKIKLNNMDTSISLCIPLSGNYDRPAYNVQQIKLTDVSFWVHVKIASRITSYRKVGLFYKWSNEASRVQVPCLYSIQLQTKTMHKGHSVNWAHHIQRPRLSRDCGRCMERPSANDQSLTVATDVPPTTRGIPFAVHISLT